MAENAKSINELVAFGRIELVKAENKLRAALQNVDAGALLTSYAMYRMVGMGKDSAEDHGRPAPAAVELAAFLLMPFIAETKEFDGGSIQAGIDALAEYLKCYSFCEVFSESDDDSDAEKDLLQRHLRLHSGVVRGTAYPSQVERRITRVFSPFEADLSALAGIGPIRSAEISKALLEQIEDNIENVRVKARSLIENNDGEWRSAPEERDRIGCEIQDFLSKMGCLWVPTFDELTNRLGDLERSEWEAFRRLFGLTPDSLPTIRRVVDVQDRPVIFLDADSAFAAHGVVVFDAIFNHFDSVARSNVPLRDSYGRQVSRWMEEETAAYFCKLPVKLNISD